MPLLFYKLHISISEFTVAAPNHVCHEPPSWPIMATHTIDFTKVKALFFDKYATLIDWEPAMYSVLSALIHALPESDGRRAGTPENRQALLRAYAANEKAVEAEFPTMPYPKILQTVSLPPAADLFYDLRTVYAGYYNLHQKRTENNATNILTRIITIALSS